MQAIVKYVILVAQCTSHPVRYMYFEVILSLKCRYVVKGGQ